jgi:methylated-DNA-protein-cysteine methyltransferase-like protein
MILKNTSLNSNKNFSSKVVALVSKIPSGRVMTYGQIASLIGHPGAARVVGGVTHYGDPSIPWHRVVNKSGGLAISFPGGGRKLHSKMLQLEGIEIKKTND